ncbi:hypothetical protein [Terrabacter sp. NPDC080008]|uniref:hypothetical protein n=1 Tax=Terrabacter sp. NPDC080008 TaxID=3155176 RepID=UPI00344FDF6C
MDVEWTVIPPATGRAHQVLRTSEHEDYRQQLAQLLRQGTGYTEVARAGSAYPALTLSINEDLAVVHRFDDAETCLLLEGTGQVPADEIRDFQIQDDPAGFTGRFITTAARGIDVLNAFAKGADVEGLGVWVRL